MLLGITGRIGTGKSEVARILKRHGAFIISADAVGKSVVEKNPAVLRKLVRSFGEGIIGLTGELNRRKLGRLALATEESRRRLNEIVHPFLLKELELQANMALRRNDLVVIDAALLIDWGWQNKADKVVLVHSPLSACIKRLMKKGYSLEEARIRLRSQLPYSVLKQYADFIIQNSKSLDYLEVKVRNLLRRLV